MVAPGGFLSTNPSLPARNPRRQDGFRGIPCFQKGAWLALLAELKPQGARHLALPTRRVTMIESGASVCAWQTFPPLLEVLLLHSMRSPPSAPPQLALRGPHRSQADSGNPGTSPSLSWAAGASPPHVRSVGMLLRCIFPGAILRASVPESEGETQESEFLKKHIYCF